MVAPVENTGNFVISGNNIRVSAIEIWKDAQPDMLVIVGISYIGLITAAAIHDGDHAAQAKFDDQSHAFLAHGIRV